MKKFVLLHDDFPSDLVFLAKCGKNTEGRLEFIKSNVRLVVASIFVSDIFLPSMALNAALEQISSLYALENIGLIKIVTNSSEVIRAEADGKIPVMISLEGAEPIININFLEVFYRLGMKFLSLTHNRQNIYACGTNCGNARNGLSAAGRELVEEAMRKGIIIDLSHINKGGFKDISVIRSKINTSLPMIATHSNSARIYNVSRNLTDSELIAIKNSGGIVGLNTVGLLIAKEPKMLDLVRHAKHIMNVIGSSHMALGLDFCEKLHSYISQAHPIIDVVSENKVREFLDLLSINGFNDNDLDNICENSFFNKIMPFI